MTPAALTALAGVVGAAAGGVSTAAVAFAAMGGTGAAAAGGLTAVKVAVAATLAAAAVAGGAVATKPLWSPSAKPVAGASSPVVRAESATPQAQPTTTVVASTAPSASAGGPAGGTYPPAGTYDLGSPPTIYDAGGLKVTWTRSQVYPYSTVPNLWYVELTYLNTGDATQHFTCTGWTDPGKARQYLYRGGNLVGSDGATETMCSSSPNWTVDLPAGNSFVSWAKFGTVPQSGDSVALEWGEFGRTPTLSPYAEG